jgi:hypothetical protein
MLWSSVRVLQYLVDFWSSWDERREQSLGGNRRHATRVGGKQRLCGAGVCLSLTAPGIWWVTKRMMQSAPPLASTMTTDGEYSDTARSSDPIFIGQKLV